MALIVSKFGGTSVASPERIKNVAKRLIAMKQEGNDVVAVVSAMGKTTDELVAAGPLKYYDRNFVAPRLTELKGAGVLEVVGKKPSKRTGKNTAVWAAVRR